MPQITHILVPTDGSELSLEAARYARMLANATNARVSLLTVLDEDAVIPGAWAGIGGDVPGFGGASVKAVRAEMESLAQREQLDKTAALLGDLDAPTFKALRWGHAATTICGYAEEIGADLIVMGSHGRTGLKAALLGSVSLGVLSRAERPVLIVR
ncbi:MAG: universal stress protein [Pseudomonadota bacterium]